jgi:hypothetical protein
VTLHRIIILAVALLASSIDAQRTVTQDDVVRGINVATRQIIVITPSLEGKRQADALLVAARVRGVKVFILADTSIHGGNRVQSLSLVDGIQVRSLKGLRENTVILDNKILVTGPEATNQANPLEPRPTTAHTASGALTRALKVFQRLWTSAKPFQL